MKVKNGAFKDP